MIRLHSSGPAAPALRPPSLPARWRRRPAVRRPSTRIVVLMALLVVYVVWGSTYLAIGIAVETMPPMLLGAVRFSLAGAALYAWSVRRGDREADRPTISQWRSAFVTGFLLLVGGTGMVMVAQTRLDSSMAALLVSTVPLWMALIDRFVGKRHLPRLAAVGVAIGIVGVAVLVRPRPGLALPYDGVVAVLIAALCWSLGSLHARGAPMPRRPMVAASMEMLAASAGFAMMGVARGELEMLSLAAIAPSGLVSLAYLTVFGSIVAFTAYAWLIRNASTSLVSTYAYINPIVAVVLGAVVLGETIAPQMLLAGAIILGSVALMVAARNEPLPAQPTSGVDALAGTRWSRRRQRAQAVARRDPMRRPFADVFLTGAEPRAVSRG